MKNIFIYLSVFLITGQSVAAQKPSAEILAQIKVNETEAASPSLWVSGWRPAVGWTCVLTIFLNFIIFPLWAYYLAVINNPTAVPELDASTLLPILLGILGLRTYERFQGIARTK